MAQSDSFGSVAPVNVAVTRNTNFSRSYTLPMSLFDYERSKYVAALDEPFHALIMAAMRQADTDNLAKLQFAFPETWRELIDRYNAPGGVLESDAKT